MKDVEKTAVRRAASTDTHLTLTRSGATLCLATNAKQLGTKLSGDTRLWHLGSAGEARKIEAAFAQWVERVPVLRCAPSTLVDVLVRFRDHLEGFSSAFEFQSMSFPKHSAARQFGDAVFYFEASLATAYRRAGRRWRKP